MSEIRTVVQLTLSELQPILDASLLEGYSFIQKLWDEYQSGEKAFNQPATTLLGGYEDGQLIAVGGVHPDPYLKIPTIGRIRHVYVLPGYRRSGVGKKLVETLIDYAAAHFTSLTLRTPTEHGRAFYKALGFSDAPRFAEATHWMEIRTK